MLNLLEVGAIADTTLSNLSDKDKCKDIMDRLEAKLADKREVLNKLEAKANEVGSDNLWNKYEAVDEAYGYGEQLKGLLIDLELGDEVEDIEWQIKDISDKCMGELRYRLERAQW